MYQGKSFGQFCIWTVFFLICHYLDHRWFARFQMQFQTFKFNNSELWNNYIVYAGFLNADNGSNSIDQSVHADNVSVCNKWHQSMCFCPVSLCGATSLTICKAEVRVFHPTRGTISAFIQEISHSNADPFNAPLSLIDWDRLGMGDGGVYTALISSWRKVFVKNILK